MFIHVSSFVFLERTLSWLLLHVPEGWWEMKESARSAASRVVGTGSTGSGGIDERDGALTDRSIVVGRLSAVPKTTALTSTLSPQRSKEPEPPKRPKGRRRKKEPRRMTLSMRLHLLFPYILHLFI